MFFAVVIETFEPAMPSNGLPSVILTNNEISRFHLPSDAFSTTSQGYVILIGLLNKTLNKTICKK